MNENCVKGSKNINEINIFEFLTRSDSEIVVNTIVTFGSLK